jgi:hypothetical protein
MKGCARRQRLVAVGLFLGLTLASPGISRGDGGTLRVWKQDGRYDLAVFTEPSPLVTGPVDISVLLLDRDSGVPVDDARITLELAPADRPEAARRGSATRASATNKLFRSVVFESIEPGPYHVVVELDGPAGSLRVDFEMVAARPWNPLMGIWSWILWPVPVILLYLIHLRLVARSTARIRG